MLLHKSTFSFTDKSARSSEVINCVGRASKKVFLLSVKRFPGVRLLSRHLHLPLWIQHSAVMGTQRLNPDNLTLAVSQLQG